MYTSFFQKCLFPVMEKWSHTTIQKDLRWLHRSQWWSREEIEDYQNKMLKSLIHHAYHHVPYYNRIFKKEGLFPGDIKTKADLEKIPILTKEEIRNNLDDLVAQNFGRKRLMERHSSGSTGAPLKYYISPETYSLGWAQTFRCWNWAGYQIGDPYVKITFPRTSIKQKMQDLVLRCTIIPAFQINEASIRGIIKKIMNAKPVLLRGYPSSVYILAKMIEQQKMEKFHVTAVMTTGATLFPHYRETIESVLDCEVFDAYGGEGNAVAYECPVHDGYHIAEEGVALEFINSRGEICTGDIGEMVVTNLTNYAMPLIRYNIQDIGKSTDRFCACGRKLAMIKSIEGRTSDIIVTPARKLLTIHFFSGVLRKCEGIDQYEINQEKIDKIVIKIVKNEKYREEDGLKIVTAFEREIGEPIDISIELVSSIPLLESGKRRFVVSKVPIEFE